MGMLVEEANPDRSFLLGEFKVSSQIIDILADFAFRSHLDRNGIFYVIRTLLRKHHLEDMGGQKHPNLLLPIINLTLKQKDERAYRILRDNQRNRDLNLFTRGKTLLLEFLPFNFILVGVDDFSFELCESGLGIISYMDEDGYFIGRVEVCDDSHLNSISLIEQLLFSKARSLKPYPEFFSQSLIVRIPFNAISFIFENFHFICIISGKF